jgi:elongation factor 3
MQQGETEPQEGSVYKHPALRIGYVSQHATHHIGTLFLRCARVLISSEPETLLERHLEKTPIQYIQWRFQDGHDRKFSVYPLHHDLCAEDVL